MSGIRHGRLFAEVNIFAANVTWGLLGGWDLWAQMLRTDFPPNFKWGRGGGSGGSGGRGGGGGAGGPVDRWTGGLVDWCFGACVERDEFTRQGELWRG